MPRLCAFAEQSSLPRAMHPQQVVRLQCGVEEQRGHQLAPRQIKNRFPGWQAAHDGRINTSRDKRYRCPMSLPYAGIIQTGSEGCPAAGGALSQATPSDISLCTMQPPGNQGIKVPLRARTGGLGKSLPPDRRERRRYSDPAGRLGRQGRPGSRVSCGTSSRLFPWGEVQGCGRGISPPG